MSTSLLKPLFLSGGGNVDLSSKQDTLVSGTNIKTINGSSVLGSGDLPVSGGSWGAVTGTLYNQTDLDAAIFPNRLWNTMARLQDARQGSVQPVFGVMSLGDSWALDPLDQLLGQFGLVGELYPVGWGGSFSGGATLTQAYSEYALTPWGNTGVLSGSGHTITIGRGGGLSVMGAAKYAVVMYSIASGGGTFQVQFRDKDGTYRNIGSPVDTSVGTNGDAAIVEFDMTSVSPSTIQNTLVRCVWVSGTSKILAGGACMFSNNVSAAGYNRAGIVYCPVSYGGSSAVQWDATPLSIWKTLSAWVKPSICFVRESREANLTDWQTAIESMVGKVRSGYGKTDFVFCSSHPVQTTVSSSDETGLATDAFLKTWCPANGHMFVDFRRHLPADKAGMDKYDLMRTDLTKTFTAATDDTITSASHGFTNNGRVTVASTGTLPGGLTNYQVYYVINATTNTFKLSLTSGGSAVDITSTGSGTHTAKFFDLGQVHMGNNGDLFCKRILWQSLEPLRSWHLENTGSNNPYGPQYSPMGVQNSRWMVGLDGNGSSTAQLGFYRVDVGDTTPASSFSWVARPRGTGSATTDLGMEWMNGGYKWATTTQYGNFIVTGNTSTTLTRETSTFESIANSVNGIAAISNNPTGTTKDIHQFRIGGTPTAAGTVMSAVNRHGAFRMVSYTTTQRDALTNLEEGEVIYNSTTKKLNFYNGTSWEAVTSA